MSQVTKECSMPGNVNAKCSEAFGKRHQNQPRFLPSREGNHAKPALCRLLGFGRRSRFQDKSFFCPGKLRRTVSFRCSFRITSVLLSARHSLRIHFSHTDQDNSILQRLARESQSNAELRAFLAPEKPTATQLEKNGGLAHYVIAAAAVASHNVKHAWVLAWVASRFAACFCACVSVISPSFCSFLGQSSSQKEKS